MKVDCLREDIIRVLVAFGTLSFIVIVVALMMIIIDVFDDKDKR